MSEHYREMQATPFEPGAGDTAGAGMSEMGPRHDDVERLEREAAALYAELQPCYTWCVVENLEATACIEAAIAIRNIKRDLVRRLVRR